MKKFRYILLILVFFTTTNVWAKDTSKSSIVIDNNSGRILYQKNANKKMLIASTTKIMTAILAIENENLNKTITVGNEILDMYGTNIYIEKNEKIKTIDLLYGLILRSGNDAAKTLAVNVGGTEENFVKMMNNKAKLLGMNNTHFENSHGLDDNTKNISTSYDMAQLSRYASKNKIYMDISKTKKYRTSTKNKSYLWYNRNKLLNTYKYCTGGKNGFTPAAGRTLVTTAQKNGLNLSIVTLNDNNTYQTHKYLYEKIYNQYKNYILIDKKTFFINNKTKGYNGFIKKSFEYPLKKDELKKIKTRTIFFNETNVNNIIGYIEIKLNDEIIGNVNIYKKAIKKEVEKNYFSKIKNYLLEILKKLKLGLQNNLNPGLSVPIPPDINSFVPFTL